MAFHLTTARPAAGRARPGEGQRARGGHKLLKVDGATQGYDAVEARPTIAECGLQNGPAGRAANA
jgi:hypothetical protein